MAQTKQRSPAAAPVAEGAEKEFPQTLEEFCARQSAIKSCSLISGFFYDEKAAGRLKDIPSAYAKRYAEFADKPAI